MSISSIRIQAVLVACMLPLFVLSNVWASTIYVPRDYGTIQEAIDAADDGMEIVVLPGIYNESINFVGKAITVRSTDPESRQVVDSTILVSDEPGLPVVTCDNNEGPDTVLNGFTITSVTGGGMHNVNSSPTVKNCVFMQNHSAFGGGMYNEDSHPFVKNCAFIENSADVAGGGMYNLDSSPRVKNSTFKRNIAIVGGGLYEVHESFVPPVLATTIEDCMFSENAAGSGGAIHIESGLLTIEESSFCENSPGDITGGWRNEGENTFSPFCPVGDLNGDGAIDVFDLLILLSEWGQCEDPDDCPADLNGHGVVNVLDLLILLEHWG